MKTILTLTAFMFFVYASEAQTVFSNSTSSSTLSAGPNAASWAISGAQATSILTVDQTKTDYLYFSGFDLSALPGNVMVSGIFIFWSRTAGATVIDSAVRIVLGGTVYYASGSNAAESPSTWNGFVSYNFSSAALTGVTGSQLKGPGFGIAISGLRTAGTNVTATVASSMSIVVAYTSILPLNLAGFYVKQNANGSLAISFSTFNEQRVEKILVEHSANGVDFVERFGFEPKGGGNVYSSYNAVDWNPVKGNNYYRIAEIDRDGNRHIYSTKKVFVGGEPTGFKVYADSRGVVCQLMLQQGKYTISLADMSGVIIQRREELVNARSISFRMDIPALRPGIYIVNCSGEGQSYSVKIPVFY